MEINFHKFQGTGNDFIMVDATHECAEYFTKDLIQQLCNRKFGIGADGLILLLPHTTLDFEMRYFNSDGSSSFCGNGARCAVMFAYQLGYFKENTTFLAIDGVHTAQIKEDLVALKMNDVLAWEMDDNAFVINTGSPHYVKQLSHVHQFDVCAFGRTIRYSDKYNKEGINVNVYADLPQHITEMLTYERGVENETLSCGTGATAVALAKAIKSGQKGAFSTKLKVKGGALEVTGHFDGNSFHSIYLIGPAEAVFHGSINI